MKKSNSSYRSACLSANDLQHFLQQLGLRAGQHLLLHTSFRALAAAFPDITPRRLIEQVQKTIGAEGSLIMPAFSYCFKTIKPGYPHFDRAKTPSAVGTVAETFRLSPEVIRTSSATHSFSLWGKAAREICSENAPTSPLGVGSVLEWLAGDENSAVVMLGVNFRALTFGHYLEVIAPVPWVDVMPWGHLGILPVGVSNNSEQELQQVPGCSGGFVHLENTLIANGRLQPFMHHSLRALYVPVTMLMNAGLTAVRLQPENMLCPAGGCVPCDVRREWYILDLHHKWH